MALGRAGRPERIGNDARPARRCDRSDPSDPVRRLRPGDRRSGLAARRCCGAPCVMAPKLSIAVVEQDHERALMIIDGLRDAGDYDITVIGDVVGLARRLAALAPDVVLIDLESPDRDVLDALDPRLRPDRPPGRDVRRPLRRRGDARGDRGRGQRLRGRRAQPRADQAGARPRRSPASTSSPRLRSELDGDQGRARGAQGRRPRQGDADEGQGHRARRRPTPRCAGPRWPRAARSPTSPRR